MCPFCLSTAAMIVIGTTTTGGLTALAMKNPFRRFRAKNNTRSIAPDGNGTAALSVIRNNVRPS